MSTHAQGAQGLARALRRWVLAFVLGNLALFAAARLAFLAAFVHGREASQWGLVLLFGARLDLIPIAVELATLGVMGFARRVIRVRVALGLLLAATLFNALYALADHLFYRERSQHWAGLLVDNARDPEVLRTEALAFAGANPGPLLLGLLGLALLVWLLRRLVRRVPEAVFPVGRPALRGWGLMLAIALCFLPLIEPVRVKQEQVLVAGHSVEAAAARHYARLDDFLLHEALPNPLGELLVTYLPAASQPAPRPRLGPAEALAAALETLGRPAGPAASPLEHVIESPGLPGVDSVLVVQVESLSAALLDPPAGATPVLPRLRELAERSLWFTNAWQSFSTTAGGVFATVTGLPRTALGERRGTFTPPEVDGVFDSLPRILGPGHEALFAIGFHQSAHDYRAFAAAQGYRFAGGAELRAEVQGDHEPSRLEGPLGLFDGPLLEAVVRRLARLSRPFVAHVVTSTSHPPWAVPSDFESPFGDVRLRAFHYVDQAIQEGLAELALHPDLARRTLVVVLGDHTNITFGGGELERWRIPLVLHNPALAQHGLAGRRAARAAQVDVLPTVLALLGGRHRCACMGRNLLDPEPLGRVLSGTLDESLYARGDRLLRWRPFPESLRLVELRPDGVGMQDLSAAEPEVRALMERECFALYETAARLTRERRVVRPER